MERIQAFHIKAEPTGKAKKHLEEIVTSTVNAWLEGNPGITNVRISHSAHTEVTFPSAFVIVTYEAAPEPVELKEKAPLEEVVPGAETKRRGRPPKE